MLGADLVRKTPLPCRHIAALLALQFVQGLGERSVDLGLAGLDRRCGLVVAPPGIVPRQHAFKRIEVATLAQHPVVERRAQFVSQNLLRQMAHPAPVDQRCGLVNRHRPVETRQLALCDCGQWMVRSRLQQARQQPAHGQRLDIALHAAQVGERMPGCCLDHLLDALVTER